MYSQMNSKIVRVNCFYAPLPSPSVRCRIAAKTVFENRVLKGDVIENQ
jgi:hypothetical protein